MRERPSRSDLVASFQAMWIAPAYRRWPRRSTWRCRSPAALCGGRAHTGASGLPPRLSPGGSVDRSLAAPHRLTAEQTLFLRKISRKTWAFFETFVGPEDHWLPPDNYQEHPVARGRASHLADQHGTGAPGESVRLRLRLHFSRTTRRTHGECTPHDGSFGATPGPLLQLVRHAVSAAAVAHLHFDRGQRQPGGPSADLAGRVCSHFPISQILGARWFDGLSRHAQDCRGHGGEEPLRPRWRNFRRIWRPQVDSRPTTLAAARLCLERLATSAEDAGPQPRCRPREPGAVVGPAPVAGSAGMPSMS